MSSGLRRTTGLQRTLDDGGNGLLSGRGFGGIYGIQGMGWWLDGDWGERGSMEGWGGLGLIMQGFGLLWDGAGVDIVGESAAL